MGGIRQDRPDLCDQDQQRKARPGEDERPDHHPGLQADPGAVFAQPVELAGEAHGDKIARLAKVAPIFRFETEEEALEIANGTPFGLAAYFYTTDMARAFRFGEALEAGLVGLNTGAVSHAEAPFGGVKSSGLGREGAQEGIEEYLETKAFHFGGL